MGWMRSSGRDMIHFLGHQLSSLRVTQSYLPLLVVCLPIRLCLQRASNRKFFETLHDSHSISINIILYENVKKCLNYCMEMLQCIKIMFLQIKFRK